MFGNWPELPLRTVERVFLEKGLAEPGTLKVLDKAVVSLIKAKEEKEKKRMRDLVWKDALMYASSNAFRGMAMLQNLHIFPHVVT